MRGYSLRRCASSDYCGNPCGQKHSRRRDSSRRCNTRKLAGNRPDYGEGLYSGQSKLAEQGNAGEAFGPKGPLGSGSVVSGLRVQGQLLRFAGLVAGPAVQR